MSYLTFKIISILVMLVILLVVIATKKSGEKQEQEQTDNNNAEQQPIVDEYQLRRTTLYRLEYKLIPYYIGDLYFLLLHVAADLGAKSVKHQDKQTTLQN